MTATEFILLRNKIKKYAVKVNKTESRIIYTDAQGNELVERADGTSFIKMQNKVYKLKGKSSNV